MLPTNLNPKEEGGAEGAADADFQNFVAVTIEHLSHREKINIKAELLKQMMLRDRKMLFRK